MFKVNWDEAPDWAKYCGVFPDNVNDPFWTDLKVYKFLDSYITYDLTRVWKILESRPNKELKLDKSDETYTIKLDSDSMNEAVVKFLIQCYRDNQMFREDDGIQDSILDVIKFCTTESEYDSILAELGIE